MLYKADILAICPQANPEIVEAMVAAGDAVWQRFGVDTPVMQAKFMAQVVHESASLTRLQENLNYTADRLCTVWPKRFPSLDAAKPFARNPQALANKVYGGRMGNVQPDDGWRYRGRGLIQLTGRDHYRTIGKQTGIDLEANPDLVSQPDIAFQTALAFWQINIGDKARTASVRDITKIINGGLTGLADRERLTECALDVLQHGRMPLRLLERGCKGNDVRLLQAQLVELGGTINIDGAYGPATAAALEDFQRRNSLPVDGVCDEVTRLSLTMMLTAGRQPVAGLAPAPAQPSPSAPEHEDVVALAAQVVRAQYGDVLLADPVDFDGATKDKITQIKEIALLLWGEVKALDSGRETALALTKIEEAVMWAEKSAACTAGHLSPKTGV